MMTDIIVDAVMMVTLLRPRCVRVLARSCAEVAARRNASCQPTDDPQTGWQQSCAAKLRGEVEQHRTFGPESSIGAGLAAGPGTAQTSIITTFNMLHKHNNPQTG